VGCLRSVFVTIAFILILSPLFYGSLSSRVSASSIEYYLSGIIVGADKATYVCGEEVRASATLFSGNMTVANFPVSIRIWAPSGGLLYSTSDSTDDAGVASFSFPLSSVCDIGAYAVTVSSQGLYDSVNSYTEFTVSLSGEYVNLTFDRPWYNRGEPVNLTGQLLTSCDLAPVNNQPVQLYLYGPDNGYISSSSTRTKGSSFTSAFTLSELATPGLYHVAAFALAPCAGGAIYGNVFFSVIANVTQPWDISISLDNATYEMGRQIVMSGTVVGGPYFYCQLGWACYGIGTFPPVNVTINITNVNGTEVYSTTQDVGLYYYPPGYAFQQVFSGLVDNSYLVPGVYVVVAMVSAAGYPTVQTSTSFAVVST
jgi:hypothetical protein